MTQSTAPKKPLSSDWKVGDKAIIREHDHENAGIEGTVIDINTGNPRSIYPLTLEYRDKAGDEQKEVFAPKDLEPVEAEVIPFPSTQPEMVEHPAHYGGKEDPYEVIKVAEAWGLDKDAYLFNVLKYIARAGKKQDTPTLQDLRKALFYLGRKITNLVKEKAAK